MTEETELPLELQKAIARQEKATVRMEDNVGFGGTTAGMAISQKYIGRLTEAVIVSLKEPQPINSKASEFIHKVGDLDPMVIALCCLQTCLHSVGNGERNTQRSTLLSLGAAIAAECWAYGLTHDEPRLAARITKAVRARHSSLNYRRQAARSIAHRAGYDQKRWSRPQLLYAGGWLWNVTLEALPDLFEVVDTTGGEKALTIRDKAWDIAAHAISEAVSNNPVYLPMRGEPPLPWTGWNTGGPRDPRLQCSVTFLRSHHKDVAASVRHAIKSGAMQPALDAVNALQAVPLKINKPVLEVLQWCIENKLTVKGIPPQVDIPTPPKPMAYEAMSDDGRRLWKFRVGETKRANRGFKGERSLLLEDVATAELLQDEAQFYVPMNCDWRTRIYGLSHFNFQRDDRVRALFLFANGEPIGEDGLQWLKIHVANCGDFEKVSKEPIDRRLKWVEDNLEELQMIAVNPFDSTWWMQADKPFLFLAACIELTTALANSDTTFVTHLPVSFDGSCSGLQHLCAMTRAEEGSLVNLTSSDIPQDVYQTVADLTEQKVRAEPDPELHALSDLCIAYGITRKLVKRNVMTYSYSSKKFGMAEQQREDLMRPLAFKVMAGSLPEHPFGEDDGHAASKYLAAHVFDAIEEVVRLPAQAMQFLQKLARALAHEGKPLRWTTPAGVPWINRYHQSDVQRVNLWLQDGGVRVRSRMTVAVSSQNAIDKDKAANGVAPNFVHACDASHLMMVVNAAVAEGITSILTIHDSFGCLASRATEFNRIIREQFVRMYEDNDMLAQVLEQAKHDLTQANWDRLPTLPVYGSLQLNEVINARYAFS